MAETAEDLFKKTELKRDDLYLHDLISALHRLDCLLERATAKAQEMFGPEAATDRYRGLYISEAEVERLLAREPGAPTLCSDDQLTEEPLSDSTTDDSSRLAWLQRDYGLSLFDLDLILIALAPELDRRYERLYAYLQDHVSCRRPSVDLALNLLCPEAITRIQRRNHFNPDAPLIQHGLLHLIPDSDDSHTSLLAHTLKLDEQIIRFLLHQTSLDARLVPFCQWVVSSKSIDGLSLDVKLKQMMPGLVRQACDENRPLRLYFHGSYGIGKRHTAAALATKIGLPLLVANLAQALEASLDFPQTLCLIFRYAWFHNAILFLDGLDSLRSDKQAIHYQQLIEALSKNAGVTILAGTQPLVPAGRHSLGLISVPFPIPDFIKRRACWQTNLAVTNIILDEADLDVLASRFRLTSNQIAESVATAHNCARWNTATRTSQPTIDDLFKAARAQSRHDLSILAQKIEPFHSWDDIVLPEDTLTQLREICQRVAHRHHVLGMWGFDRKLSQGKGVNALFSGPSGTGKTMAADIVANDLGLDLYKIDLSGVVSKYIGETEKNLNRIFSVAENANAILLFDEADALFGKRSEVRDSHDRYANIEISYLLQKMEEYEGLSILTTNLRQNMDNAFVRRMAFAVNFPFPNRTSRRRLWEGIWPAEAPLDEDIDLDFLARQFKLAGGNIKNIALAAAFLAVDTGGSIQMTHLLRATQREYQKMGKVLSEAEIKGTSNGQQSVAKHAGGGAPVHRDYLV